ncbi:hypothetical protein AB0J52_29740 [Spirillospora sp. NPDC049652]
MRHPTTVLRRMILLIAVAITATLAGGVVSLAGTAYADPAAQALPTFNTGPIPANSLPLQTGPGGDYPMIGYAQPFTSYTVACFSTPSINPGEPGPYTVPGNDMTVVWALLANPSASPPVGPPANAAGDPVGYVRASNLHTGGNLLDQAPRCVSDPPPAPSPTPRTDGHPVVGPQPPGSDVPHLMCKHQMLDPGTYTIDFTSEPTIDIEFSASAPTTIDVKDTQTGASGSGFIHPATGATEDLKSWHFTEKANGTGITQHLVTVTVTGAVVEGSVGYIVRSTGCGTPSTPQN